MCTCIEQITSLHLITIKLISGFSSLLHYFPPCINVPNYRVSSSQLYLTQESNHTPVSIRSFIGQSARILGSDWLIAVTIHTSGHTSCRRVPHPHAVPQGMAFLLVTLSTNKTQYLRLRLYDSDFNALDCSLT